MIVIPEEAKEAISNKLKFYLSIFSGKPFMILLFLAFHFFVFNYYAPDNDALKKELALFQNIGSFEYKGNTYNIEVYENKEITYNNETKYYSLRDTFGNYFYYDSKYTSFNYIDSEQKYVSLSSIDSEQKYVSLSSIDSEQKSHIDDYLETYLDSRIHDIESGEFNLDYIKNSNFYFFNSFLLSSIFSLLFAGMLFELIRTLMYFDKEPLTIKYKKDSFREKISFFLFFYFALIIMMEASGISLLTTLGSDYINKINYVFVCSSAFFFILFALFSVCDCLLNDAKEKIESKRKNKSKNKT